MSLAGKLKKWSDNQLINEAQAKAILAFEKQRGQSRLYFGFGGLGVLCIILSIASIVAANWDSFSSETKLISHALVNLGLAGVILGYFQKPSWIREVLVTILAGLFMTFIALIGQVLQTQAPIWQPFGVWLVLATPMLLLYARFSGVVWAWLGILGVFAVSLANSTLSREQANIFLAGLPFVVFIAFGFQKAKEFLSNWSVAIYRLSWAVVILCASAAQIFWSADVTSLGRWWHLPMESIVVAGIGVLAVFLLDVARRYQLISWWGEVTREWDALLIVSYGLAVVPMLIPHSSMPFIGALIFCLYWLFVGILGLRSGSDGLWSLAVLVVGIRIFVLYVEIMGSLAMQGMGFLFSGVVFLFLGWAIKKIIQHKPRWMVPSDEGRAV